MSVDAAVLAELARARRERRASDVDWFEKLYQVYVTVIGCLVALISASAVVGGDRLSDSSLQQVRDKGPVVVGAICALVVVAGARSGGRGGPLTLEAPFVHHVLLAPVDRQQALRGPAARLLTQATLTGGGVGALAGLVASERMPESTVGLAASGAAAGAATALVAVGLALAISGRQSPMWTANLAGAAVGLATGLCAGHLALAGAGGNVLLGLGSVVIAAALGGIGFASAGGISIEAAQRRAGLVSSLRLAVTRQDLRAVVLLHRRLSLDRARREPWFSAPTAPWPVWQRGMESIARLPARRILRICVFGAASVVAASAATSTPALIVAAGLALHAAALDLDEAFAQELDHPTRWLAYPTAPGRLLVRHLAAPATVLILVALPVARGVVGVTAPLAAVVGAACSVAMPPFEPWTANPFAPPEAIGMTMILRAAWPVGVTVAGLSPIVAPTASVALLPAALALVWLSRRQPERG